jgi:serine protease AprX
MIRHYTAMFLLIISSSLVAQEVPYSIKLKYKKNISYSLSKPSSFLSQKAIDRRNRYRIPIDSSDLPVNTRYIDSIASIPGVRVASNSKWLNTIFIETSDPSAIEKINSFYFVDRSEKLSVIIPTTKDKVSVDYKKEPANIVRNARIASRSVLDQHGITEDSINYGMNAAQVNIHEGEFLHKLGFRGQGMTIAILDGGFKSYKTNPALDSVRNNGQIKGEYDFVMNEISVNEDNVHGANCFTILAANRPGFIVGTAPKANYWLFRTEDAATEKPIEEQNWIAAVERADSAGADMISSSLGYANFDDPSFDHTYANRDGNTALITIAADMAAKKGMLIMNSAGNSGNASTDLKYIFCPADGDSVMTVGAVNASGSIAPFSSWGPNYAGKIKPNIVSLGWNAVYANTAGDPVTGNGTSYSNPNIAGLIACLWQAFPEFTNMQVIDAVQKSADRYSNPDDRYGYGIPNFRIAYNYLESVRQQKTDTILKGKWITAFPVPFRRVFTVFLKAPSSGRASIRLFDIGGRLLLEKSIDVLQGNHYTVPMNVVQERRFGIYFLQYTDGKNKTTLRLLTL